MFRLNPNLFFYMSVKTEDKFLKKKDSDKLEFNKYLTIINLANNLTQKNNNIFVTFLTKFTKYKIYCFHLKTSSFIYIILFLRLPPSK